MNRVLKERWTYFSAQFDRSEVLPDGCRDIVIKRDRLGNNAYLVTPLASHTECVEIEAGSQLLGFRLAPGTQIKRTPLNQFIQCRELESLENGEWLNDFCQLNASVEEALTGLGSELGSIDAVAAQLGVSIRTLQRYVKKHTGVNPVFWRSLARARRCGRVLSTLNTNIHTSVTESLADAAVLCGYADQAHMTRDMKQWFNCTPLALYRGQFKNELWLSGYD